MATVAPQPISIRELAEEALAVKRLDDERRALEAEAERRRKLDEHYAQIERRITELAGKPAESIRAHNVTGEPCVILAELPHLAWTWRYNAYHRCKKLYVTYPTSDGPYAQTIETIADLGAFLEAHPGN